jgi:hypothetical protein
MNKTKTEMETNEKKEIQNNLKNEKIMQTKVIEIKQQQPARFGCYKEDSPDARCCGVCYCCCRAKNIDKEIDKGRCECCPNDFNEYWYSGYVQTTAGYGNRAEDTNGCCCFICFPLKFPVFFPCFIGSLVNQLLNTCCATSCCARVMGECSAPIKRNYLF